jgi:hypothetical protein
MIRDYWIGGTGGGGWNVLLHLYQSKDYFVRYVHNHYVQVTLDIGVFGLITFVAWLGIFYSMGIKRLRQSKDEAHLWIKGTLLYVTVLVLHASFDFDLTFPFLFGILVCLTIPMDEKIYKLRVSGGTLGFVLPAVTALICCWGWLAIGYGYNTAANFHVMENKYTKAQELYSRAERLLPWSSSALYGSAKGYVLQGNETGDSSYYQTAKSKLLLAHKLVPDQTLYKELLDQLSHISTKRD